VNLAENTLREGIKLRGGNTGNLNKVADWLHDMPIKEIANKAAEGSKEAIEAIKMLKQAATKASRNY